GRPLGRIRGGARPEHGPARGSCWGRREAAHVRARLGGREEAQAQGRTVHCPVRTARVRGEKRAAAPRERNRRYRSRKHEEGHDLGTADERSQLRDWTFAKDQGKG